MSLELKRMKIRSERKFKLKTQYPGSVVPLAMFLAVQTGVCGQLNRWPCHSVTHWWYFYFWDTKSDPRDLWPLRHWIRVRRGHDLTQKKTMTKTDTKTKTFREHLQRAIPETCDLYNIWSEWWGDMTRPQRETITGSNYNEKYKTKDNDKDKYI